MTERLELDRSLENHALEYDAPAAPTPHAKPAKAGALTGAFVQHGREKAPRLIETTLPVEIAQPAAAPLIAPAVFEAAPAPAPMAALALPERSRWTDVIFAAACCVAFFATFLFVLHF